MLLVGQRKKLGKQINRHPLPPRRKNELFLLQGLKSFFPKGDVVGAVEDKGAGDRGSADFFTVEVDEGAGGVGVNDDFPPHAPGHGGKNERGRQGNQRDAGGEERRKARGNAGHISNVSPLRPPGKSVRLGSISAGVSLVVAVPLFIVIILALFVVGDLAWLAFAWGRLKGQAVGRWILSIFMALMGGGLVLALLRRGGGWPQQESVALSMAVFLWHLLFLPLGLVLLFAGAAVAGAVKLFKRKKIVAEDPAAGGMSRRRLLGMTLAVAPPAAVALTTGYSLRQRREFAIRHVDLPIAGLPAELDGLSIAHLADTHLGEFSDERFYNAAIDAANGLKADLIVHTGDVINHDLLDLPAAMKGLARLSAPLGVFVCEGNHDLIANPTLFRREISKLTNLRFLRTSAAMIYPRGQAVQILGVRWPTPVGAAPAGAAPGDRGRDESIAMACVDAAGAVDPGSVLRIALAHHPHAFDYLPFAHLTLSGHTHGGQLNLTKHVGCGAAMYRYWSGLYEKEGRSLFVSNGTGNWFPLRINAPAELVRLTLRRHA